MVTKPMPAGTITGHYDREKCWNCQCGMGLFIRLFHTALCIAVTGTLLWKDSALRRSLVELENPLYGAVYIGLVGISLVLYFTTCYTNPGYVIISHYKKSERHNVEILGIESEQTEEEDIEMCTMVPQPLHEKYKYRYCDYCEIQPPIRSKHCKDCKLCVHKYDHHCPWLEACIGERNHKYFWSFLLTMVILILWTFIIVWESFVSEKLWTDWFHSNLVLFFDTVVLVLSGPVVVGLFVFHTYLLINGLTTWEATSRERITYLKHLEDDFNPFNEGCVGNIQHFFCSYRLRKWEVMYTQRARFKDGTT